MDRRHTHDPTRANGFDTEVDGAGFPCAVDGDVHAHARGQVLDVLDLLRAVALEVHLGAQLERERRPLEIRLRDVDPGRPGDERRQDRQGADRPAAHDQDGIAGGDAGAQDRIERDGRRLHQGALLIGQ
jgi:hypothetical protein